MSRPVGADWEPLRESDPVAGDAYDVRSDARHYGAVASELADQIARLRAIGADTSLKGDYAETMRSASEDLADSLSKVVRRYDEVAGALEAWAPRLEEAQDESLRLLMRAQAAERERAANAAVTVPDGVEPTAEDRSAAQRRDAARGAAEEEIEQARRRLEEVLQARDEAARATARRIRAAIDDDVKDSWWDNAKGSVAKGWQAFKRLVTKYVEGIKKVLEVLSWIATVLAVVVLLVPGLNLIVWLAISATLLTLAGHTALASTGNGSWTDVGLDVFGIATLGAGKVAGAGLKAARAATVEAGSKQAAKTAAASARRQTRLERIALGKEATRKSATPSQRASARRRLDDLKRRTRQEERRRGREAEEAFLKRRLPKVSLREAVEAGGDHGNAKMVKDIARIVRRFPQSAVLDSARSAPAWLRLARGSFGAGFAVDAGDKLLTAGESVRAEPTPVTSCEVGP